MIKIEILNKPLNVQSCFQQVEDSSCGGIDIFIGTVRNQTHNKQVVQLEFEAYEPMAIAELEKIAQTCNQKWPIHNILVQHRIGVLKVGEIAVIIAVAAAHRAAAFDACRYIIDTLKQTVPIWKKEVFNDGAIWVAAHP